MKYHPNPLIDRVIVACVTSARRALDPAVALTHCLLVESDHPTWTPVEAGQIVACIPAALKSLEQPAEDSRA